eukprot:TRINITY_DN14848_c0_g1_i1.p1 TRINITY_DN14848_c0_g1~~TRINITY_DN14848_c0_g1_i1.p1  ORF type:complete len:165 (-),score=35.53 TRINITY_DN14848_c0_g1_i1:45-539(-)
MGQIYTIDWYPIYGEKIYDPKHEGILRNTILKKICEDFFNQKKKNIKEKKLFSKVKEGESLLYEKNAPKRSAEEYKGNFRILKIVYLGDLGTIIETPRTYLICYCDMNNKINTNHKKILDGLVDWSKKENNGKILLHYIPSFKSIFGKNVYYIQNKFNSDPSDK